MCFFPSFCHIFHYGRLQFRRFQCSWHLLSELVQKVKMKPGSKCNHNGCQKNKNHTCMLILDNQATQIIFAQCQAFLLKVRMKHSCFVMSWSDFLLLECCFYRQKLKLWSSLWRLLNKATNHCYFHPCKEDPKADIFTYNVTASL